MRVSPNSLAVTTAFGLGVLLASMARGPGDYADVGPATGQARTIAGPFMLTSHHGLATLIGVKTSR